MQQWHCPDAAASALAIARAQNARSTRRRMNNRWGRCGRYNLSGQLKGAVPRIARRFPAAASWCNTCLPGRGPRRVCWRPRRYAVGFSRCRLARSPYCRRQQVSLNRPDNCENGASVRSTFIFEVASSATTSGILWIYSEARKFGEHGVVSAKCLCEGNEVCPGG